MEEKLATYAKILKSPEYKIIKIKTYDFFSILSIIEIEDTKKIKIWNKIAKAYFEEEKKGIYLEYIPLKREDFISLYDDFDYLGLTFMILKNGNNKHLDLKELDVKYENDEKYYEVSEIDLVNYLLNVEYFKDYKTIEDYKKITYIKEVIKSENYTILDDNKYFEIDNKTKNYLFSGHDLSKYPTLKEKQDNQKKL